MQKAAHPTETDEPLFSLSKKSLFSLGESGDFFDKLNFSGKFLSRENAEFCYQIYHQIKPKNAYFPQFETNEKEAKAGIEKPEIL